MATDNRAVVTDEPGWVNNRQEGGGCEHGTRTSLDYKRICETGEAARHRRTWGFVTRETKVGGHWNVRARGAEETKEKRISNRKEMGREAKEWRGDFLRVLHSEVRRSQLNPQMLFMQEDPDSDLVSGRRGHLSQRPSVIGLTFQQSTYDPHCLFTHLGNPLFFSGSGRYANDTLPAWMWTQTASCQEHFHTKTSVKPTNIFTRMRSFDSMKVQTHRNSSRNCISF